MNKLFYRLDRLFYRLDGQGLVEYALVLVLVAVVVIAILSVLGPQVGNVFSQIMDTFTEPTTAKLH